MRELLEAEGLESWPKITGGKRLHVMAPLLQEPRSGAWLREVIAQQLAQTDTVRYVTVADPAMRAGRIFIDCGCG